jgi:3-deoxy-D-manno-octulosonate 8-phosphate phosphatase KdsC-like HAD superfamily phosphatase
MKKKAIICDIDGCLLDTAIIHKEIEQKDLIGAQKWAYFERFANNIDKVSFNYNLGIALEALAKVGINIILLTARSESIRKSTARRLDMQLNCKYKLVMRNFGDEDTPRVIKKRHLENILKEYEVILAIDDEDENLKMFSAMGLFVMKAL